MGTKNAVIPDRFLPRSRLLFQTIASSARGRLDIRGYRDWESNAPGAQAIVPTQGVNTWLSCDNISWWPDFAAKP